jgi:prevent-host-death family protein
MVMTRKQPFALVYADEVKDHLGAIEAKYYSVIQSAIETQLLHEPGGETRNRKPLQRPIAFGADWELRLGPDNRFRVFYQIDTESRKVRVLAVGVKDGNRLFFGGKGVCRMKIASVADVKARLSAYLRESEEGPVVVTRNGKAVAVLLAVTDDDELERLVLAHSPKFQALLDRSRRQIEETGGIPHAQFWREVEAESRAAAAKGHRGSRRTRRGT